MYLMLVYRLFFKISKLNVSHPATLVSVGALRVVQI